MRCARVEPRQGKSSGDKLCFAEGMSRELRPTHRPSLRIAFQWESVECQKCTLLWLGSSYSKRESLQLTITLHLIGGFVWVSGDTFPVRRWGTNLSFLFKPLQTFHLLKAPRKKIENMSSSEIGSL